jgi:hypothetical protein
MAISLRSSTQLAATLLFVSFFLCSTVHAQTICNYKYRKRISFDPTRVAGPSDLSDFPALIKFASDNDLRTVANSGHVENVNGYDIIFTADDGVTVLNHELQYYVPATGQFTAWVKVPTLSTTINTYIYMYYGNAAIVTDQSNTALWTNYHAAWHLETPVTDNSGNNYTLTNNGTANQNPAYIDKGRLCSGDFLEVNAATTFPNLTTNYTISGWAYTSDNTMTGQRIFCDDENNSGGYALSIGDGGTGGLRFYSRGSTPVILDAPNGTIANNTWYYCVAVADISNGMKYIYVNGVLVASASFTGWSTDAGDASLAGETAAGETGNRLNGMLDEVRIAKTALSANWLLTEYNNQSSPSTFYTVSAEPKVWNGGVSTAWNNAANWLGGVVPAAFNDVIINNGTNQPTLNIASQQISSLWIRSGATLSLSSNILNVAFDITNCGTLNGGTGLLNLNSTAAYIQNQNLSGTGTYNLNNFTVNNTFATAPRATLNRTVSVSGALTLTSGIVYTTTTNILALGTAATSNAGSAASFVSGPMSKSGNTNFVFPVGKGSSWRRCSISNITASTTFSAEYFNTPYVNITSVNAPMTNVSSLEYWQIDRTVGTGNANVSLYWENAGTSGITNCPDLTIARFNGASWDERPATTVGGASCAGAGTGSLTTNAAITAFSPFTFGSRTWSLNPLPVELLSFNAVYNSGKVDLSWQTATETNNDYFTVERSLNAVNFENVLVVDGAGNSSTVIDYFEKDHSPYHGLSYYRLKQTDFNGDSHYSSVVPVNYVVGDDGLSIYPNPVNGNETFYLSMKVSAEKPVLVVLRDIAGREFYSKIFITTENDQLIAVDPEKTIAPGVYLVVATSENRIFTKKLIVK